ncbi:MAG: galactose-1-phosphate uridylyltransferase [Calditrichaeota bacterium]|nr:galactose-1-phosphate uridylyltransferase [Calditrichota bacterium]MCB0305176.1 galactose-1-phosphate uridylyltransferase [Calditrichota bacterium]
MPELRKDPVIGRWVIISTERGRRPSDFLDVIEENKDSISPFSPNNEHMTPPEIYAIRPPGSAPNTPGWTLRVVPNKYPALKVKGQLDRRGEGIYDMINGIGAHEVIIETPDKTKDLGDLEPAAVTDVLRVFKERMLALKKDARLKYVMIFKNKGPAAGATLKHAHSQLIATPIIPKRVLEEIEGAQKYFAIKERCIFCDIISQELKDNIRVVHENKHFIALSPFAARSPFETWILPRGHASHYETIDDASLDSLAAIMKTLLQKLNVALEKPAYNFVIHTAPIQEEASEVYHWHIELLPKLTRIAGFEWGSGFYINPTSPEEAARYLKEIVI